ncbi:MAG: hypothetical protein K0Q76_3834 [Panacagrimonas sp.]|jgi:hypothetical protein|nr:DUF5329 domain-containing protein [Panacagrimonas sp.]MCC2658726.1 hypothetical protein [Panacagrimonas sp.]
MKLVGWILVSTLAAICALARAEPPPHVQREVAALMTRLSTSGCEFYRNGAWHDAAAAREHLEKKYRYLARKNLVPKTEDFIKLGGTESSMSHEPYQVRCAGQVSSSSAWLTRELGEVRSGREASTP